MGKAIPLYIFRVHVPHVCTRKAEPCWDNNGFISGAFSIPAITIFIIIVSLLGAFVADHIPFIRKIVMLHAN